MICPTWSRVKEATNPPLSAFDHGLFKAHSVSQGGGRQDATKEVAKIAALKPLGQLRGEPLRLLGAEFR